mmetsp:Transcript_85494/g.267461  ORF Transcript_85494/g.267461 Transcript_85494/m.267461 type:complete len:422 (-) Transcript_85494:1994-3259(-)
MAQGHDHDALQGEGAPALDQVHRPDLHDPVRPRKLVRQRLLLRPRADGRARGHGRLHRHHRGQGGRALRDAAHARDHQGRHPEGGPQEPDVRAAAGHDGPAGPLARRGRRLAAAAEAAAGEAGGERGGGVPAAVPHPRPEDAPGRAARGGRGAPGEAEGLRRLRRGEGRQGPRAGGPRGGGRAGPEDGGRVSQRHVREQERQDALREAHAGGEVPRLGLLGAGGDVIHGPPGHHRPALLPDALRRTPRVSPLRPSGSGVCRGDRRVRRPLPRGEQRHPRAPQDADGLRREDHLWHPGRLPGFHERCKLGEADPRDDPGHRLQGGLHSEEPPRQPSAREDGRGPPEAQGPAALHPRWRGCAQGPGAALLRAASAEVRVRLRGRPQHRRQRPPHGGRQLRLRDGVLRGQEGDRRRVRGGDVQR